MVEPLQHAADAAVPNVAPASAPDTAVASQPWSMGDPGPRGRFGSFGGRFVPEALSPACEQLEAAFRAARADAEFGARLAGLQRSYAGRPTPVTEATRLSEALGVRVLLKREDLAHTGSHKIEHWAELVDAGATDLGGLSANGDHISPEHAFPSPHQVRKELAPKGYALTERLCVYPQYMDPEWMEQGVLDVVKLKYWSFIPRRGSGRRTRRDAGRQARRDGDRQGARGGGAERGRADGALRRDAAAGDRGDAGRGRRAARRAGRGAGDLRRQPQHQLHQHLRRRLRLLRLRPGQALARRLRGLRGGLRRADRGSGRVRRDRDLHAGRDPPRPDPRGVRQVAAAGQAGRAAAAPARLLADGGPLHVRALGQGARARSSST